MATGRGTFKKWLQADLSDYVQDIAEHGADAGYPKLTYYVDTCQLYDEHADDIWGMLNEDADNMGQTVLELIASFNSANSIINEATFKNLLTWYAAERCARELMDEKEESETTA